MPCIGREAASELCIGKVGFRYDGTHKPTVAKPPSFSRSWRTDDALEADGRLPPHVLPFPEKTADAASGQAAFAP